MKKTFTTLAILLLLSLSCKEYDDSALWNEVNYLASRITWLEELCNETNTNITSIQTAIKALERNDYITNVAPINENSSIIGYTITFAKSGSITIYNGRNGMDGNAPTISARKDKDDIYYWTINGEWLLDDNGKKIKAEGQDGKDGKDGKDSTSPQFKIEDEYWHVSYDNGNTWEKLNKAKGEDGKTPDIDIRKSIDGIYYWTINGEWLLDDNGEKIKAEGQDGKNGKDGIDGIDGEDGITPQLKIEKEYWYISYDNGKTWNKLDKAKGEDGKDGTSIEVTEDSQYIYLTFSDGTVLIFPKATDTESTPVVTTGESPIVNTNYAIVTGKVENVKTDVTVGIIYDTTMDISENSGMQVTKTASGVFTITLKDLKNGTIYYYRAFALIEGKYYLGEIQSFKTILPPMGIVGSWSWIDLGLSSGTKWAITNLGAKYEDERGTPYAWGAIGTQKNWSWSAYQYSSGSSMIDIGIHIGGTNKDAASYNRTNAWRMPTKEEMEELIEECTKTWTQVYGVNGIRFTGPNGGSIFLPTTGQNDYSYTQTYGCYWTETRTSSLYHAYFMTFGENYVNLVENTSTNKPGGERSSGYYIRPVLNGK